MENKKVTELKELLKNLQLSCSGTKEKLIARILEDSDKKSNIAEMPKFEKILEEINWKNNIFFRFFLTLLSVSRNKVEIPGRAGSLKAFPPKPIYDNISKYYDWIKITSFTLVKMEEFFKNKNIEVKFISSSIPGQFSDITIGNLIILNDELLAEIIIHLTFIFPNQEILTCQQLNIMFIDFNLPFRILEFPSGYEMVKVKSLYQTCK